MLIVLWLFLYLLYLRFNSLSYWVLLSDGKCRWNSVRFQQICFLPVLVVYRELVYWLCFSICCLKFCIAILTENIFAMLHSLVKAIMIVWCISEKISKLRCAVFRTAIVNRGMCIPVRTWLICLGFSFWVVSFLTRAVLLVLVIVFVWFCILWGSVFAYSLLVVVILVVNTAAVKCFKKTRLQNNLSYTILILACCKLSNGLLTFGLYKVYHQQARKDFSCIGPCLLWE